MRIVTEGRGQFPAWLLLLLPLVVLIPLVTLIAAESFDGLYGQDAYSYSKYSLGALSHALRNIEAPPAFHWPPGYPLPFALLSLVFGPHPEIGQGISLAAAASVPLFTALIARSIWPNRIRIAFAAGILTAVNPQLWQSGAVVMSDALGLACAVAAIWALTRYAVKPETAAGWLLVGAALLAYAVLTRWAYALLAFPALGFVLWQFRRLNRFQLLGQAILATGMTLLVLWPVLESLVTFLQDVLFLEGAGLAHEVPAFMGDFGVYRWTPANAFQSSFQTTDGYLTYTLPNGLYYLALPFHRHYFQVYFGLFLLPGLWVVLRSISPDKALIVAWAAAIYVFHAGAAWQNFRFALAYLPALAIIAAVGYEHVERRLPRRWGRLMAAGGLLGALALASNGWTLTDSFIQRKHDHTAMFADIQQRLPADSRVMTLGLTLALRSYTDFEIFEVFHLTPDGVDELQQAPNLYLLADAADLANRWVGRNPGIIFNNLAEQNALTILDTYSIQNLQGDGTLTLTLYEVVAP